MSKIVIMQGLPASGKSTEAAAMLKKMGNGVRINKDLLRTMLHFDKWSGRNEDITRSAARMLAKGFLADDVNVIIDDTNLNPRTLQSWVDLGKEMNAKTQVYKMPTTMEECLARDAVRGDDRVGESVIVGMAMQSGLYPTPEQGVVICDIDGTLANIDHRLHFVKVPEGQKKDWKGFFAAAPADEVNVKVIDLLLSHVDKGRKIFIVTGRPDTYREQTKIWIDKAFKGVIPYEALFMRRADDKRPDDQVKADILRSHFRNKSWIVEVIDDRPSVIRMWREQGLQVVDVGEGLEF